VTGSLSDGDSLDGGGLRGRQGAQGGGRGKFQEKTKGVGARNEGKLKASGAGGGASYIENYKKKNTGVKRSLKAEKLRLAY